METKPLDKKTNLMTSSNTDTINTVEVLQRRWLSDSAFEIELTRPPAFEFAPGQAIRLIHDSIDRYYSIISTPEDTRLTLCVYHVPRGISRVHRNPAPRVRRFGRARDAGLRSAATRRDCPSSTWWDRRPPGLPAPTEISSPAPRTGCPDCWTARLPMSMCPCMQDCMTPGAPAT